MVTLSKIFSREKSLFHYNIWDKADRLSYERFLGYKLKHNLFIVRPSNQKGSVWYSPEELKNIERILVDKSKVEGEKLLEDLISTAEKAVSHTKDYLLGTKKIESIDEMMKYYENQINFWSILSSVFFNIPDIADMDQKYKEKFNTLRNSTEKFAEKVQDPFIQFISDKFPEISEYSYFITPEELEKYSKNSSEIKDILRNRKDGCFILDSKIYDLSQLENKLKENNLVLEEFNETDVDSFEGSVAYKGVVRGLVKIIGSKNDIADIEEGRILVTEMTDPNYLPGIKKAAAIVTDEGGALCHAAIVSRELKKPCIIGTKIATQVLKDGMEVEVDADNGIVRILS